MAITFYASIKPLLFLSKILGLIAFEHSETGYKPSRTAKYRQAIIAMIYLSMTATSLLIRSHVKVEPLLLLVTDILQNLTTAAQLSVIWISTGYYQERYTQFLQEIIAIDKQFGQLEVVITYEKLRRRVRIGIVMHISFVAALLATQMSINTYAYQMKMVGFSISMYFPLVANVGVVQQVSTYFGLVRDRFKAINERLISLQSENFHLSENVSKIKFVCDARTKLQVLRITCYLHLELTKLAKNINQVFDVALLATFAVGFVTITVSLYYFTIELQGSNLTQFDRLLGYLAMCGSYIFEGLYICHVCDTTVEEANNTGKLLHQIDYSEDDVKDQIEMFSLQIANENLQFSAAGFFPIDYTLVFSIIGGITTYLIILIQFSSSSSPIST